MKLKLIKSITIYCSSSNKINKKYIFMAKKLGVYLANKKIKLVYGGGSNGLMGEISRSMKLNGGFVTGVIPKFLKTKENLNKNIDNIIIVSDMAERKKILFEKADAFIALPGGPGTIEEITEIISWYNLGLHKKPIILFNHDNFWNPLIKMYSKTYKKNFVDKDYNKLFYVLKNFSDIKKII